MAPYQSVSHVIMSQINIIVFSLSLSEDIVIEVVVKYGSSNIDKSGFTLSILSSMDTAIIYIVNLSNTMLLQLDQALILD